MNKLNAIYVSILALIVAVVALVMCIMCCNKQSSNPAVVSEEGVMAVLSNNPQMIIDALQRGEAQRQEAARAEAKKLVEANIDEINNYELSPVIGNENGKVTVVEFFDFACGYCHKLAPTLMNILDKNSDVRLVLKPLFFLSPQSQYAAKALYAVDKQGKAKEFYMNIMENPGQLSEAKIDELAVKAGVDLEKMKADMNSAEIDKAMTDTSTLAERIRVTGVPTLVVEGNMIQTLSESDIQQAIDQAK